MVKKKTTHGGKRPGAGRPLAYKGEGKAVPVVASVPERLVKKLDTIAAGLGWNRSKAVTEAIRLFIDARHVH